MLSLSTKRNLVYVVGLRSHRRGIDMSFAPSAVLAFALVLALAGCGVPGASPVPPSDSPFPRATQEPEPEPTGPPVSLHGTDCDDLVSTATVHAALAPDVVIMSPEARLGMWQSGFYDAAIQQAGGIVCLWGNGDPGDYADGRYVATLRILPRALSAWEANRDIWEGIRDGRGLGGGPVLTVGDESLSDCASEDHRYYGTCQFFVRVGEYWLDFDIYGVPVPTEVGPNPADAIVREVAETVGSLPDSGATWGPPAGTREAPADCAAGYSVDAIRAAFGVAEVRQEPESAIAAIEAPALAQSRGLTCGWRTPLDWVDPTAAGRTGVYITVQILPGASWYWDGEVAPPYRVDIRTLSEMEGIGDAAWGDCFNGNCTVHAIKDNTWYALSFPYQVDDMGSIATLANLLIG